LLLFACAGAALLQVIVASDRALLRRRMSSSSFPETASALPSPTAATTPLPPLVQQQQQHYKLTVAYNGARFNGFQKQAAQPKQQPSHQGNCRPTKQRRYDSSTGRVKGVPVTIQECLEQALLEYGEYICKQQQQQQQQVQDPATSNQKSALPDELSSATRTTWIRSDLRFRFAGRTDKGVHAQGQVVTCLLPTATATMPPGRLRAALNSRLPEDISVQQIAALPDHAAAFDPRHDAVRKEYSYMLKFRRLLREDDGRDVQGGGVHSLRSAHDTPVLWLVPWPLETDAWPLLQAALQGTHDYTPFVHRKDRDERSHVMTIDKAAYDILQESTDGFPGTTVVTARWTFTARGFRRSLVRNLVGFIVQCSRPGQTRVRPWSMGPAEDDTKDWTAYIEAAPASGLSLDRVDYAV
jgi:tRNA pseudouridine38-40 synthase